jgi:hypothetical protein
VLVALLLRSDGFEHYRCVFLGCFRFVRVFWLLAGRVVERFLGLG